MLRARTLLVLLSTLLVSAVSIAQPGPMGAGGPGLKPTIPPLTKQNVEKLIVIIPLLAKESGNLRGGPGMGAMGGLGPDAPKAPMEDLQRVEKLLNSYGYSSPEFFMQFTTLLSTYLALAPKELDKKMPNENQPEIRRILNNPSVSTEEKAMVRQQIKMMNANKDAIRAQLLQFATEENKKVVKPMLAKIAAALERAEKESRKAWEAKQSSGPRKGPVR